jgi:hypothetical protein
LTGADNRDTPIHKLYREAAIGNRDYTLADTVAKLGACPSNRFCSSGGHSGV